MLILNRHKLLNLPIDCTVKVPYINHIDMINNDAQNWVKINILTFG